MALGAAGGVMPGMFSNSFKNAEKEKTVITIDTNAIPDIRSFHNAIYDWAMVKISLPSIAEKYMAITQSMAQAQKRHEKQPTPNGEKMDWSSYDKEMHQIAKMIDDAYRDSDVSPEFKEIIKTYGPAIKGYAQQHPTVTHKP
jgi:hypothetical protein